MKLTLATGIAGVLFAFAACSHDHAPAEDPLAHEQRVALPERTLADPLGADHALRELARVLGGLIAVVTAPTLANQAAQEGWSSAFDAGIGAERGRVVFLQDMSVSWFADTAKERMAAETEPDANPLLLLDESGEVARALGVAEGETVLIVFDAKGNELKRSAEDPSAELADRLWAALEAARSST